MRKYINWRLGIHILLLTAGFMMLPELRGWGIIGAMLLIYAGSVFADYWNKL